MSIPLIVILTIAAYFVLLMIISKIASRGSDNDTFFTGNRRVPWGLVAFATIGASISGVTFISVPGKVATDSYAYLQMILGFVVGYFVIAYVLVPVFYRRNLKSIYGYLEERFGGRTYKTGAWFFFVSKMLGAAVRFFVVCVVLQALVFGPLHVPFVFNVIVTIALIWLYTMQGGVKTVIWTDNLKSFCLIMSVILCIYFVAQKLGLGIGDLPAAIAAHPTSRAFFFDDWMSGQYFWKQFVAGIFLAVAMTGLDQDLMQRTMACKDYRSSQKNLVVSGIVQFFVVALFLFLGTLLMMYMDHMGIKQPAKTDEIFGLVAADKGLPVIVCILFVLGLVSAAYSAAGSALTAMTTSFTCDILQADKRQDDDRLTRTRKRVHIMMSVIMGLVILVFYYISDEDAIGLVYKLASYTYGPILGLFVFGMFGRRAVRDHMVPVACVLAPALSWVTQWALKEAFDYTTGFELLLINAAWTILGLWLLSYPKGQEPQTATNTPAQDVKESL